MPLLFSGVVFAETYVCDKIIPIDMKGYGTDKNWKFKYEKGVEHQFTFTSTKKGVVIPQGDKKLYFPPWKKYDSNVSTTYQGTSVIVKNTFKNKLTFYLADSKIPVDKEMSNIDPVFMVKFSECYIED